MSTLMKLLRVSYVMECWAMTQAFRLGTPPTFLPRKTLKMTWTWKLEQYQTVRKARRASLKAFRLRVSPSLPPLPLGSKEHPQRTTKELQISQGAKPWDVLQTKFTSLSSRGKAL